MAPWVLQRTWFISQPSHAGSQPPVTAVLGDRMPLLTFVSSCTRIHSLRHMHTRKKSMYIYIQKSIGLSTLLISYTFIAEAVLTLLLLKEAQTFITHSSHSLVVTLFCDLSIHMYLQPTATGTQTKFMSFFYCVILPVLNPSQVWEKSGKAGDLCLSTGAAK